MLPIYCTSTISNIHINGIHNQNYSTIFRTIKNKDSNGNVIGTQVVSFIKARKIAQEELNASIAKQQSILEDDTSALRNLENAVANGIPYEKAYAQSMDKASAAAKKYVVETKGAAGTTDTFVAKQKQEQAELKATATAANGTSIAMKALSIAGNMAVGFGISFAISIVTKLFYNLATAAKRAEESASSFAEELRDLQKEQSDNSKKISELSKEYNSFVDKVSATGRNIGLTSDEYGRYQTVVSEISEIMPNLTTYFDEQGNKIGFVKNEISDLNKEYKKYIQNNAKKLITEKDDEGKTNLSNVIDNYNNSYRDSYNIVKNFKVNCLDPILNGISESGLFFGLLSPIVASTYSPNIEDYGTTEELANYFGELASLSKEDFIDAMQDLQASSIGRNQLKGVVDVLGLSVDDLTDSNMSNEDYNAIISKTIAIQQSYKDKMSIANNNLKETMKALVQSSDEYISLTDEQLSATYTMISNLSDDFLSKNQDELDTEVKLKTFVNKLMNVLTNEEGLNAANTLSLFNLESFEGNIIDYRSKIYAAVEEIASQTGESVDDVLKMFRIDDEAWKHINDILIKYDKTKEELKNLFPEESDFNWDDFFDKNGINTEEEYDKFLKIAKGCKTTTEVINEWNEKLKIQEKLSKTGFKDLFNFDNLEKSTKAISTFTSSISSLQSSLSTLQSSNYSSTELLSSLTALQEWAGKNNFNINFSSFDNIDDLSSRLNTLVNDYVDKTIKILNVDPDSKFAKILKNVATESVKVQAKIDGVNKSLSNISGAYKTVTGTIEEYNKNGYITLDTIQNILSLDSEYLQCLTDENGKLTFNKEAYIKLAKAQIEQAKTAATNKYVSELQAIAMEDVSNKTDDAREAFETFLEKIENADSPFSNFIKNAHSFISEILAINKVVDGEVDIDNLYENARTIDEAAAKSAKSSYETTMNLLAKTGNNLNSAYNSIISGNSNSKSNTNYYNPYEDFIKAKEYALEKFTKEDERLNNIFTKAIEKDNENVAKSVDEKLKANNSVYSETLEKTISETSSQIQSVLNELYNMSPELKGKSVDEILGNSSLLTSIGKSFDDQIINAQNAEKNTLESNLTQAQSKFESLISSLTNLVDKQEEWNKSLLDIDTKQLERIKTIYDELSRKREFKIDQLSKTRGTENEQIKLLQEGMADDHKIAEELRAKGYEEGSSEIQGYQEAYLDKQNNIKTLQKQVFENSIEDINNKIADIDFQIEINGDKEFIKNAELIEEQIMLTKDEIWKTEQEIKRLDELYANCQNDEEYIQRKRELTEQLQDYTTTMNDYYKSLQDNAQAELDTLKEVEDTVIEMIEDKYDTLKDQYEKRIELEKEYIDDRKKLLQDLLDQYEKKWAAEDEEADRQDKLKDRNDLVKDRNQLVTAAATGSLEAMSEIEDLDEQISDIDKDLANDSKESFRDSVRDRINDEIDGLEDLSSKYDEDLEKFNALLDEKLKKENIYAEAHKAMETGIFENACGQQISLSEAYKEFRNRTAEGFSIIGATIQSEFIDKLIQSEEILNNLPTLLSQVSELGVRDYLEAQGYNVDWDNNTKEILVNGVRISDTNFSRSEDGRLIATSDQINELLDKYGFQNSGIKAQKSMQTDVKTATSMNSENTKTPQADYKGFIPINSEQFTKLFENIDVSKLSANLPTSINNSLIGDMHKQLSKITGYKFEASPINIDNSFTIQGNADVATVKEVKTMLQKQALEFPKIVAKEFMKSLNGMGTV